VLIDVGILIVSIKKGDFESGFLGQTREHMMLLKCFGVSNIIVVFNKADLINWDANLIQEYTDKMMVEMKKIKFNNVEFCPVSGITGENLTDEKVGFKPCLIDRIVTYKKRVPIKKVELKETVICKIMILDTFKSVISKGFVCVMHSESHVFNVQVLALKDCNLKTKTFAKAGEMVMVKIDILNFQSREIDILNFQSREIDKNIVLRLSEQTIGFGVIVEKDERSEKK
jgi:translation elongation factor EF-1alpha